MTLAQMKLLGTTLESRYSKEILNKLDRKADKSLSEDKFQSSSKSRLIKVL